MLGEDSLLDPEIERLSERLSKDPDSLVFAPLADAYRKSGLIEEAIDILRKGMDRHPSYASAYIILGRCYQDQKMYELARSEFEKALEVAPENFLASRLYADVLVSLGQKEEAIKRYRSLLEFDPGNIEVREALEKFGPTEEEHRDLSSEAETSVFDFGKIDAEEPNQGSTDIGGVFGAGEGASEEEREPIRDLGSVFDKSPAAPPPLQPESGKRSPFDFGTIPEAASEEPEKEKDEEKPSAYLEATVVKTDNSHARGHDLGGLVVEEKVELPEPEEAGLRLERSAVNIPYEEGQPDDKVDSRLAEIYLERGFVDKAINAYESLIEMEPSNQDYKKRLAEIKGDSGPTTPDVGVFPSEILEPYTERSGSTAPSDVLKSEGEGPSDRQNISLSELFTGEGGDQGIGSPTESPHPSLDTKPEEEAKPEEEDSENGFDSFQSWLDDLKE